MAKKKSKKAKVEAPVKKWFGTWPANCDICKKDLNDQASDLENPWFVDGATLPSGRWGLLCPSCFAEHGVGLGTGKGQKYSAITLRKIEG